MKKKLVLIIVAVGLLAAGWYFFKSFAVQYVFQKEKSSHGFSKNVKEYLKEATPDLRQAASFPKAPVQTSGKVKLTFAKLKAPSEPTMTFISSGIPFAEGQLFSDKDFIIYDEQAKEIPLAVKVLARWPKDQSIRSVLVQLRVMMSEQYKLGFLHWGVKRTAEDQPVIEPTWKYPQGIIMMPAYWMCDSKIMGELAPFGQRIAPKYDQNVEEILPVLAQKGWTGGLREVNYYSTAHVFYQLFARTSQLKYYVVARNALLYYREKDLILEGPKRGSSTVGPEPRYVYVEALIDDYLLTGDPRSREIAGYMAEYLKNYVPPSKAFYSKNSKDFWTERLIAFPFLSAVHYYELTGDKEYLKLADEYMINLHKTQMQWPNRGGFIHNLYAHDVTEGARPDEYGGSPFMTGLLLEAVIHYHRMTESPIAADSIFRALDWLIAEGLDMTGEAFKYMTADKYASDPGAPDLNLLIAHAFGYGYRLSGYTREDYLEIGQKIFFNGVNKGYIDQHKQFNQNYRSSGHYLAYIQDGLRQKAHAQLLPETEEPVSGNINRLAWSERQKQVWSKMYSENHFFWKSLKSQADGDNYGDRGMRDGLVYLITGDEDYAYSAWQHVNYLCGRSYQPAQMQKDPSWCKTPWKGYPHKNATRDQFVRLSILFSWIADALSAEDKRNFRDILDHWADLVLNIDAKNHGTRSTDSDEIIGHYFGLVLYALAIQKEDPKRSEEILNYEGNKNNGVYTKPVGGLDATGENHKTMRNTIALFAKKAKGGQWIESSEYNLTTVRYMLVGVSAINDFLGEDKFPEVTSMYDDYARSFVEELTPDLKTSFEWGDVQTPRDLKLFQRIPIMAVVAYLSKDPQAAYIFDYLTQIYRSARGELSNTADAWPIYIDPYLPKKAPSGHSFYNAEGIGIAYWRNGWTSESSFFASKMFNPTFVDHDWETLSNFNLYRNGRWVINNPKGYYGNKTDQPWMNGLMINGGISRAYEASGQTAYQAGNDYLYHAGAAAGQLVNTDQDDPPTEFVHEWNRSILFLDNKDRSNTVIVFDRVNSCNPLDKNCMTENKFNRINEITRKRITAANAKHQWIIHLPDDKPRMKENRITWTDRQEDVFLFTFVDEYTKKLYDEKLLYHKGSPLWLTMAGDASAQELKYQLRIIPEKNSGFMTLLNVIHVGSSPEVKEIRLKQQEGGEEAQGVQIDFNQESIIALFNSTYNIPPKPSPINDKPTHNPYRLENTKKLRMFKTGFRGNIVMNNSGRVFIFDLNPNQQWELMVNEEVKDGFKVSDQGLGIIEFLEKGDYILDVRSLSKCDRRQWQGCHEKKLCEKSGWFWDDDSHTCFEDKKIIDKMSEVKKSKGVQESSLFVKILRKVGKKMAIMFLVIIVIVIAGVIIFTKK